jgi:hypothetical protein
VARMLDPDFTLSYSYTIGKLFPDIRNPMLERARVNADNAERSPENAVIAYISFCRKNSAYLESIGDGESARLYELAAEAAMARLNPQQQLQAPVAPSGGVAGAATAPAMNVPTEAPY